MGVVGWRMPKNATGGAIPADNEWERLARRYLRVGREEARDACPIYAALAEAVASSPDLLAFLAELPEGKRQPNLFLAAVRHLDSVPRDGAHLAEIVEREREPLRALILSRSTQTNEPARCAILLPALVCLPQPLAVIEVGASAGLCLYPDRYGYDYGGHRLGGIEEPENFLHPRLLYELAEECRTAAERGQLLVTTHSPFFLNALRPEEVRVLYRDEEGYTQVTTASDIPGVRAFISEGALLGHLWVEGHFGLGDPLTNHGAPVRRPGATT
jgi:hypothetical protein